MNIITAYEIETNYPENILIEATEYEDTGKWVSQMYMTRDEVVHKLMLSFDRTPEWSGFDTELVALAMMEGVVAKAIALVKTLHEEQKK